MKGVANIESTMLASTGLSLHAVAFGRQFGVVPSGEAFQLGPTLPRCGEWAFVAASFELGRGQGHFRPGLGASTLNHMTVVELLNGKDII